MMMLLAGKPRKMKETDRLLIKAHLKSLPPSAAPCGVQSSTPQTRRVPFGVGLGGRLASGTFLNSLDKNQVCQQTVNKTLSQGFTLIELLVIIGITVAMMGLAVSFFGGSYHIQIKKETSHLIGAVKLAYNEAITKNLYYRLVFDFENQSYWLESSSDPFYLKSDKEIEEEEKKVKKDEEEVIPEFTAAEEGAVKKVRLDDAVRIKDVYVSHQEGILSTGYATLYFFPRGLTESAIIHLTDEDEANPYSIIVQPLTGRCKVKAEYVEINSLSEP